jgi:membrane fusion protein, copper/silver efflux system
MKNILYNRIFQLSIVMITGLILGWLIFRPSGSSGDEHAHEQGEESTYTCSMHPQIRQDDPGSCPICGMDLIPVTRAADREGSSPFVYVMSPEAMALANVQTHRVHYVSPEHEILLTGKVAANEQRMAVITANYSGRIDELYIDFTGQTVQKGEKLATIYSPALITAQSELIEAATFKETSPALYQAAREKLRLWKIAEEQIEAIENKGVVITKFDVYADRSGVVIRRDVSKGDFVNRGSVLFLLADLSSVWILLDAYESDLPFLRVGQRITFSVNSVPGRTFSSSISFIDPFINPQTRTVAVRAELPNPGQILKPEMFVQGKVKAGLAVRERALVIPQTSLLWTGRRSVVYVKVPDSESPAFEMREITLGASLGEYYIVESGLTEGEEIVTNGAFAIDAAAQLSGNYSMMNRPADKTIPVPDRFIQKLTRVANLYFELKNSLVEGHFRQARSNAEKVKSALDEMQTQPLDEATKSIWEMYYALLNEHIRALVSANGLEKQREAFAPLSLGMIETVEVFQIDRDTVYVTFCPMAFDNEGAYWLGEVREIKNPYFGDRMLRCGEVKKTLIRQQHTRSAPDPHRGHQH